MQIKVFVTLQRQYQPPEDFKKMVIMISSSVMIYELKRKIEKEYAELYPQEPPFVVAKLLDLEGFALSNNSFTRDVLQPGEHLQAHPEVAISDASKPLHGSSQAKEHVLLIKNLQAQLLTKIALSNDYGSTIEDTENLLEVLIPIGLTSRDATTQRNVALSLSKSISYQRAVSLFAELDADPAKAQQSLVLLEMLVLMFEHWTQSFASVDSYLHGQMVCLLEVLVHSESFWARTKQSGIVQRQLLQMSGSDNDQTIREKAQKVLKAIGFEKHNQVQGPADAERYEPTAAPQTLGYSFCLDGESQMIPAHDARLRPFKQCVMAQIDMPPIDPNKVTPSPASPNSSQPEQIQSSHLNSHMLPSEQIRIQALCKQLSSDLAPDIIAHALEQTVILISEGQFEHEFGKISNLSEMVQIIQHVFADEQHQKLQLIVVNEVVRQITDESKAVLLLQRYGLSKFLFAIKKHKQSNSQLAKLIESFTIKLIEVGRPSLPISVLYMLGTSKEVAQLHPQLQLTAWDGLAYLSERRPKENPQITGELEQMLSQLIQQAQTPQDSEVGVQIQIKALLVLANLCLREQLRSFIHQSGFHRQFVEILVGTNSKLSSDVLAARASAKGLMNLALGSKQLRQQVISELGGLIEQMMAGKCDQIVASYISALVRGAK